MIRRKTWRTRCPGYQWQECFHEGRDRDQLCPLLLVSHIAREQRINHRIWPCGEASLTLTREVLVEWEEWKDDWRGFDRKWMNE